MNATIEVDFRTYAAFKCVCDTLDMFPGWTFDPNIYQFLYPNFTGEIPRFFSFNLEEKRFSWQKIDTLGNGEEYVLTLVEEARELLEVVREMAVSFEGMPPSMTTEEAVAKEQANNDAIYHGTSEIDLNTALEMWSKIASSIFHKKKYPYKDYDQSDSEYMSYGLYSTYDKTENKIYKQTYEKYNK